MSESSSEEEPERHKRTRFSRGNQTAYEQGALCDAFSKQQLFEKHITADLRVEMKKKWDQIVDIMMLKIRRRYRGALRSDKRILILGLLQIHESGLCES